MFSKKISISLIIIFFAVIALPEIYRNAFLLSNFKNTKSHYIPVINFFKLKNTNLREHYADQEKKIEAFEDNKLKKYLRRQTQYFLSKYLNEGNRNTIIKDKNDGKWLFLRPSLLAITSYGPFKKKPTSVASDPNLKKWQAPMPVIIDFAKQIQTAGAQLYIVPIPSKISIYPEIFTNQKHKKALHHSDYKNFTKQLKKNQIKVIEIDDTLINHKKNKQSYLNYDTHWTQSAMRKVAKKIAHKINIKHKKNNFTLEKNEILANGDLAENIFTNKKLRNKQFIPQKRIHSSVKLNGKKIIFDPKSPVTLLGDSFSNIFSSPDLGHGADGGLAEFLSFELGFPIEKIAINGGGASNVREAFAGEKGSREKLSSKKAIIWAIAERDFFLADQDAQANNVSWNFVNFQDGKWSPPKTEIAKIQEKVKILKMAEIPNPANLTYKDALFAIDCEIIDTGEKIIVYAWAFRDKILQGASKISVGAEIDINLKAWQANPNLHSFQRFDSDEFFPEYFADEKNFTTKNIDKQNEKSNEKIPRFIAILTCIIFLLLIFIYLNRAYKKENQALIA